MLLINNYKFHFDRHYYYFQLAKVELRRVPFRIYGKSLNLNRYV